MTWQYYLGEKKTPIGREIQRQSALLGDLYKDIPGAQHAAEMLCEYTLRGKLLRAVLLSLSADSFGGAPESQVLQAGAALELAQSALLIHDDIIDGDTLRRGKPALHTLIGRNQAICLGDLALLQTFRIIAFHQGLGALFSLHLGATTLGQAFEITVAQGCGDPSLEEIFAIIRNKTARYTFTLPLEAGAALAGQDKMPALGSLGEILGLIFQIRDDELNLLNGEETGKTAGGDIRENKKTLCRALLLQKCPEAAGLFGKENTLAAVREAYKAHAAGDIAAFLEEQVQKADSHLNSLPFDEKTRSLWSGLLDFLLKRKA